MINNLMPHIDVQLVNLTSKKIINLISQISLVSSHRRSAQSPRPPRAIANLDQVLPRPPFALAVAVDSAAVVFLRTGNGLGSCSSNHLIIISPRASPISCPRKAHAALNRARTDSGTRPLIKTAFSVSSVTNKLSRLYFYCRIAICPFICDCHCVNLSLCYTNRHRRNKASSEHKTVTRTFPRGCSKTGS